MKAPDLQQNAGTPPNRTMNEPTQQQNAVDPRDVRAAKESMTVASEAPGLARVYTTSNDGQEGYMVGIRSKVCECPAFQYQDGKCKHIRRVEIEIGDRPVPALSGRSDVECMIEVQGERREPEVIADGGVATTGAKVATPDSETPCPHGDERCEGVDSTAERPELCWSCWREWGAYDPEDTRR